jgi:rod shape-determining protein MreC
MFYRPFIISSLIGLLLLVSSAFGLTEPLVGLYSGLISPVLAAETVATRRGTNWLTVIQSIGTLAKENAELRTKTVALEAELAKLKEVEHENVILKAELQFTAAGQSSFISAQLIGRSSTGIIKDLIIDRGSTDGLLVGQSVVAQGYLIGTLNNVTPRTSTVMLLTNPRSLVPVLLQDNRSTGILRGGISGLVVNDLLIDAPVNRGETVVTSGLGGGTPSGLPIGKIVEVISQKGDITKKATVSSPIDITKLEVVFIRRP